VIDSTGLGRRVRIYLFQLRLNLPKNGKLSIAILGLVVFPYDACVRQGVVTGG
jgi:hypothetical protein